jgi:hypothetical protein
MTDKELMQMALDALANFDLDVRLKVIPALRARLAQPEQEPVAWVVYDSEINDIVWTESGMHLKQNTPLYTSQPQREWQGLTDDEIRKTNRLSIYEKPLIEFARAIEAKLKEKNNA